MSQQMKYLLSAVAGLVVIAVVLTMFGKPPNLPLGPLQGMLVKDDATVADGGTTATTPTPAATTNGCPPGQVSAATLTGGAAGTGTTTTTPAASDSSATVGAGADGWSDGTRVVAAGGGWVDGRVTDQPIYAAEAVTIMPSSPDPNAATTDPAATPAATTPADATATPAATTPTDAATTTSPTTAGTTPTDCVPDPAASGTVTTTPPATTTPGAKSPAATAISKSTTDTTNIGNSPEALRIAADATGVLAKAQITVQTTATLTPAVGGVGTLAQRVKYRKSVTAAVLVIKLTDPTALQQWTSAGKPVQATLVKSFVTRLGKNYPIAIRSVSVVDSSGNLLAIGDAAPKGVARVKLY